MIVTRNNRNWLPEVFDQMFNNTLAMHNTATSIAPAINVIEDKDAYTVELAAPGMGREDFNVTINEDENLVIAIEKKAATQEGGEEKTPATENEQRYLRREFTHTKFTQTFIIPEEVNREAISATAENGVLTVKLPKHLPEELKREVKHIAIN